MTVITLRVHLLFPRFVETKGLDNRPAADFLFLFFDHVLGCRLVAVVTEVVFALAFFLHRLLSIKEPMTGLHNAVDVNRRYPPQIVQNY